MKRLTGWTVEGDDVVLQVEEWAGWGRSGTDVYRTTTVRVERAVLGNLVRDALAWPPLHPGGSGLEAIGEAEAVGYEVPGTVDTMQVRTGAEPCRGCGGSGDAHCHNCNDGGVGRDGSPCGECPRQCPECLGTGRADL